MKKWSRKKRWIVGLIGGFILLPVILYGGLFVIGMFNLFHAHEHCIKGTGLELEEYALDHGGRYPFSSNGFGDAIVLLLRENTNAPAKLRTSCQVALCYRKESLFRPQNCYHCFSGFPANNWFAVSGGRFKTAIGDR
jgi:hypothetical protein